MAFEHLAKTFVLRIERPVPHQPALLIERLERARQAIFRRQLPHHRIALPRGSPHMAEPEEVKRRGQRRFSAAAGSPPGSEVHQTGFVRVQLQPELPQPFPEHRQHPFRIVSVRKEHHKVIAEPDQCTRTTQTRLHLVGEPFVNDVVKNNVAEDRRDHSPYAKANFQFERVVPGWRATPVLDLRLKK